MRRLRCQLLAQGRIVERQAVDRDRDIALVVPVAFQHRLQTIQVAAGAADEAEGSDGRGAAQGDQVGSRLERGIHVAVARGGQIDLVGLRIGGAGRRRQVSMRQSQARGPRQRNAAGISIARGSPAPDLSLTCVPASCFGLPFLGNVLIRWGFPFAKVTAVEQYRGGCRLRSWFVDVGWRVSVSAPPACE